MIYSRLLLCTARLTESYTTSTDTVGCPRRLRRMPCFFFEERAVSDDARASSSLCKKMPTTRRTGKPHKTSKAQYFQLLHHVIGHLTSRTVPYDCGYLGAPDPAPLATSQRPRRSRRPQRARVPAETSAAASGNAEEALDSAGDRARQRRGTPVRLLAARPGGAAWSRPSFLK